MKKIFAKILPNVTIVLLTIAIALTLTFVVALMAEQSTVIIPPACIIMAIGIVYTLTSMYALLHVCNFGYDHFFSPYGEYDEEDLVNMLHRRWKCIFTRPAVIVAAGIVMVRYICKINVVANNGTIKDSDKYPEDCLEMAIKVMKIITKKHCASDELYEN